MADANDDALLHEFFGSDDEGGDPPPAPPPPPYFQTQARPPPLPKKKQQQLIRGEGLRIAEIFKTWEPKFIKTGEDPTTKLILFSGTMPETGTISWLGLIPRPDLLHQYTVCYKLETDQYNHNKQMGKVCKVLATKRAPLDRGVLTNILRGASRLDAVSARETLERVMPIVDSGGLSALLRQCGEDKWLRDAEKRITYFSEWYVDELTPPYEKEALRYLPGESVARIARIAVTEPWKLCTWWTTGETIPEIMDELDYKQAMGLHARFPGSEFPASAQAAIQAYVGRPFGDARALQDSYVEQSWFERKLGPAAGRSLLWACVHHKVATVKKEGDRLCTYCLGDLDCEIKFSDALKAIILRPEKPNEVQMKPRTSWWPDCDATCRIKPNSDQVQAIELMVRSKLGVVCGKPGTGKTAVVMKAVFSAFRPGTCMGISFTGMSAENQHNLAGYGVTAHRVLHEWRRLGEDSPYADRKVLVVEEASAMSMRVFCAVLCIMPSLSRVYIFGDEHQLAPVDGGASVLAAAIKRYEGTPVLARLKRSMRITDATGAFARDLDRICEHRVDDGFEWSGDPASGHPFVFMQRGETALDNALRMRNALAKAGVDPDSPRVHVIVWRNDTRIELARAWYELSVIGQTAMKAGRPYAEHEFSVGERVMFLRNKNVAFKPGKSKFKTAKIKNGACKTIVEIFDEFGEDGEVTKVVDTRVPKKKQLARRWLRLDPGNLTICLDYYGKQNITRIPPATGDKLQGLEAEYCVVLLLRSMGAAKKTKAGEEPPKKLGAKWLYSACSRGKVACFVFADIDDKIHPSSGKCPSRDFASTVMSSKGIETKSELWKRLPEYDAATADALRVDPEACVYYTKKKKKKKKKDEEEEETDDGE
jgi:RecA/RadA recombinase